MDQAPDGADTGGLRLLRILVTTLTSVMIVGFIVLIAFLVTNFPGRTARAPLPDTITLPDGTVPVAVTHTADWYAVVTAADEILVFDRATGALLQTVAIETGG